MSGNVEVNKADRYTEPSRIKMLQDVGMDAFDITS